MSEFFTVGSAFSGFPERNARFAASLFGAR